MFFMAWYILLLIKSFLKLFYFQKSLKQEFATFTL